MMEKPIISLHAANTWLLANGLHFFFWFIMYFDIFIGSITGFSLLLLLIILSPLASLPCLMMANFSLDIIAKKDHSSSVLLKIWMVTCPCLVLVEGLVVMLIFKADAYILIAFLPGMLAAVVAVLIRYPQFKQLIAVNQFN